MSSSTGEIGIIILLVVAGLLAVWLAVWLAIKLFRWALAGALYLLAFAGEQGFIGLAAYIACWVFLFPAMLVISIIIGIVIGAAVRAAGADVREEERIRKTRRQLGLDEE